MHSPRCMLHVKHPEIHPLCRKGLSPSSAFDSHTYNRSLVRRLGQLIHRPQC